MKTKLLILTLLLTSAPAQATVLLKMDLPQLVGAADLIFLGTAKKTESRWTEDKRRIVTDTTFQVEQKILGTKQTQTVVIRTLGGVVNGLGQWVAGAPVYKKGERVVLFSQKRLKHRYTVGMKQGVYRVHLDEQKKPMVQVNLSGLELAQRTPTKLKIIKQANHTPAQSMSQFITQIRETITSCAQSPQKCK